LTIDDKSFEKANEPHAMSKKKLRKVLGLVESLVSVARCTFTPFHLGLAIELYHKYGSRTLIETLFSHGFCASYTEVRRYLTSIAVHEVENMENGAFAPDMYAKKENICIWRLDNYTTLYIHVAKASISRNGV
jgi:hypothetical protein